MSTETNILLPTATVDLFLTDDQTLRVARTLEKDWRFARVKISVHQGDVEKAIRLYQEQASPSLMLVETKTIEDAFLARLGELSGHCSEDTNAIIAGPVNDVNLYRNLTSLGVSDYLVTPVAYDLLSETIAATLVKLLGTSGSRLIACIGAKGGVGTSSLAQGISWGLADMLDQKTFLMDAAGGGSTLGVGLGFEPLTSLFEAVQAAKRHDSESIERMIFKADDRLSVLASGSDGLLEQSVSADDYESLLTEMMISHPVVVVDLSGAIPSLKRTVLSLAHEIIVVSTPTLSALRLARSLLQEIKLIHDGDISNVDMVINKVGELSGQEVALKDIEAALDFKPGHSIPYDPKLFMTCEAEGKKLTSQKAGQDIINGLLPAIGERLSLTVPETQTATPSFLDKIFKK